MTVRPERSMAGWPEPCEAPEPREAPKPCEADVHAILGAFDRSAFTALALRVGTTRVAATKARMPADVAPAIMPEEAGDLAAILAPSVGTVSLAGGVVRMGGHVEKGALLGAIRLLTTEVEVRSDGAGTVASVAVEDGAFVEYGEPLVQLRPDAEGGRQ